MASAGLTCMTCHVLFADAAQQREHYKCEWHRYNLKRKGAELPPITSELFARKQLQQKSEENEQSAGVDGTRCVLCNKSFKSRQTLESHCQSKKHIENLVANPECTAIRTSVSSAADENQQMEEGGNEEEEAWSDVDSEADEGLPVGHCLFCSSSHKDTQSCIRHMLIAHGFFIPDVEYCTDVDGLLHYLGYKVGAHYVCLWCNERGRQFQSLDAVQKHMVDKQHCRMQHDSARCLIEYADYYDYSSSYPDADAADGDEELPADVPLENNWQLVLPSGATVGHRSLARYFKQRLPSEQRTLAIRKGQQAAAGGSTTKCSVVAEYKNATGWLATTGEAARRKQRDVRYMQRIYSKQRMKLGMKQGWTHLDRGRSDQC